MDGDVDLGHLEAGHPLDGVDDVAADGGGQVGDTGSMDFSGDVVRVLDTKKENDLVIHVVGHLPHRIEDPTVHCTVDQRKRHLTENNHSATHLLHAALRQVLGTHVQQKGSYLDEKFLRFDFSHFQKLTDDELAALRKSAGAVRDLVLAMDRLAAEATPAT